jgi:hypothetical protein
LFARSSGKSQLARNFINSILHALGVKFAVVAERES